MADRRTNLALLALLATAIGTGALAFATGTGWVRWPVVAHGVVGMAILILTPWKSLVVRRGLSKRRPGTGSSIALSVLVLVALASGILFSTAGRSLRYGPLNAMQLHVGAAVAAIPFAVHHVWVRRVRPRRSDLSRRNFLRTGGLAVGAGAVYLTVEGFSQVLSLPGSRRRFTGSHEEGSFDPSAMPTTQWFDDTVPRIDNDAWVLDLNGRAMSYAELAAFDDEMEATLDCTGGWFATQEWKGARLDRLLGAVEGSSIFVKSATGYSRRYPLRDAPRMLLATAAGGDTLSAGHGFPARMVCPGRRGFWWVKWVVEIRVDDRPWWLQWPYPIT